MPYHAPGSTRHLAWDGCYNTRDLGGLPMSGGGSTRWGAVIRSDTLIRLSASGRQAMLDYGVRTIIDLRGPQEVERWPSPFARPGNDAPALVYLNLPIERYPAEDAEMVAPLPQPATLADIYRVIVDRNPDLIASVLRAIAGARPGGVLIHCHAGKDRTGTVVALLLGLAGVSADIIAEDYAESQQRLWPLYEQELARAGDDTTGDPPFPPLADAQTMRQFLTYLESRYGGVRSYLAASGMTDAEIERLSSRLRSR